MTIALLTKLFKTMIEEVVVELEAINSGYLNSYGTIDYATYHDAADALSIYNDYWVWVGQRYQESLLRWTVVRGGLIFDTSAIPVGATIISATLSLMGKYKVTGGSDFDITVVSGADLADTLVAADFGDLLDDITSFGKLTTVGFLLEDWNSIALNATGLAAIIKAGTTRFGFRSSRDIDNIDPKQNGGNWYEWIGFYGSDTANKKPKLTITYMP